MWTYFKLFIADLKDSSERLCAMPGTPGRLVIVLDMILCGVLYFAFPKEYFDFRLDLVPFRERKDYRTGHKGNIACRVLNDPSSRSILQNKYYLFCVLSDTFGRTCVQNLGLTPERFAAFTEGLDRFIFKPIDSYGGRGHKVYHLDGSLSPEEMYREIMAAPRGLLEPWIIQHDALNALYPNAVHVVRLHTIHDGSAKDIRIFGGTLAVATAGEVTNTSLHNTLAVRIDEATGELLTDALDYDNNLLSEHPVTHIPFRGYRLPYWDRVTDLVRRAAAAIPELPYIGWDVAFTPDGPIIVEGNANPAIDAQCGSWEPRGHEEHSWAIIRPYVQKKRAAGR